MGGALDYNLSGLSARSFEQLAQSLSINVFGPGVVIFGDGPDGGREATFEGPMTYEGASGQWSGYMVLQAKFLQVPNNDYNDADWLVDQLRNELHKFKAKQKGLRCPEFYILASNVKLSGVKDRGGKAKIKKVFDGFEKSLKIRDWDVWDYAKIKAYLDNAESIRHAYAAWITPGDVLSAAMEQLKPRSPEFEQVLANFLQKELRADLNVNLEQAGSASEQPTPLAKVFVDLPFSFERTNEPQQEGVDSEGRLPSGFINEVLQIGGQKLNSVSIGASQGMATQLLTGPKPGKIVLIGGPGQGKTTIGQFVAQCFRASILNARPKNTLVPEVRQALSDIKEQCKAEGIRSTKGRRFPIRIVLNDLAKELARIDGPATLLAYIVSRIAKRTDQIVSAEDFRGWLKIYPWVLILDGLDEVPDTSNRDQVLKAVNEFWIDAQEANADILAIATTRPQGYNEDFSPTFYRHFYLTPLSPLRALHYAKRLVAIRHQADTDRCQNILQKLEVALDDKSSARLMRSPLQVTIMAVLVDMAGEPPPDRWNLFQRYYEVIYKREESRDIPAAAILKGHKPDIDSIHWWVGLALQIESESSGGTDARLTQERLERIVCARLESEGHEGEELANLTHNIITAAAERLVFLVGVEANQAGFEIRSLQEFMAAEALMNGTDSDVNKRLHRIGRHVMWQNVFLFAAGRCFSQKQHLRDTVITICDQLNQSEAIYAGSYLALELLEDGSARNQPKYCRSLAKLTLELLSLPPSETHKRISEVYQKNLENLYLQKIEDSLTQTIPAKRWGAWAILVPLVEAGHEWAINLAKDKWPGPTQEGAEIWRAIDDFVDSADQGKTWWSQTIAEVIPHTKANPRLFMMEYRREEKKYISYISSANPIAEILIKLERVFERPQHDARTAVPLLIDEIPDTEEQLT